MKTRAAVAFAAKQPLEIVELDLEGPKAGEVLVEIMATGICHTDAYTLDGLDSEGIFPSILGHELAGVVIALGYGTARNLFNICNSGYAGKKTSATKTLLGVRSRVAIVSLYSTRSCGLIKTVPGLSVMA